MTGYSAALAGGLALLAVAAVIDLDAIRIGQSDVQETAGA